MKLYLVQHGKALSKEQDSERPLSEEGRQEVQKIASFVKPLCIQVNSIWHSGKKRAEQTAEIMAGAIVSKNGLLMHKGLCPNDNVEKIADEIISDGDDLLVVGHLPFLSRLASFLLAGNTEAQVIAFKNGGLVCLEAKEDNNWQVDWILIPDIVG